MTKIARHAREATRVLAVMIAALATLAAPVAAPSAEAQILPPFPPPPVVPYGLPVSPFPGVGLPLGISPLGAPWAPAGPPCRHHRQRSARALRPLWLPVLPRRARPA